MDETPRPLDGATIRLIVVAEVQEAMSNAVQITADQLRRTAPRKTGAYVGSIRGTADQIGDRTVGVIEPTVRYAQWVEEGTGRFGPRRRDILPPAGRRFRFPDRGSGITAAGISYPPPKPRKGMVYTRKIRGQKPGRYVEKAWQATALQVVEAMHDAGDEAAAQIRRQMQVPGVHLFGGGLPTRRRTGQIGGVIR